MKLKASFFALLLGSFTVTLFLFQNCGQKMTSEFSLGSSAAIEDAFLNKTIKFDEVPAAFNAAAMSTSALKTQSSTNNKQYYLGDIIVDEKFVTSVRTSFQTRTIATRNYRGSFKTNATDVLPWPGGIIPLYFDEESGFTPAELAQIKSNMAEICRRWSAVSNLKCQIVTDKNTIPVVRVTQAQVPLAWANGQKLCNGPVAISCANIGYSTQYPMRYLAIHKQLISDLRNSMHEFGHILGLNHEHQRPGRENYLQFRFNYDPTQVSVSDYDILYNLPAVNNDYDFGSLMHYLVAGQRNSAFVSGSSSAAVFAYKTSELFNQNYPLNRAARNSYSAGSVGAAVGISGYPSPQDVQNVVDLYGAPAIVKRSCVLYGGQVTVPHGAIIGVYSNQSQTATNQYCNDEPRVCDDGSLVGGDRSEGYRTCPLRCTIAGQQVAYGDSLIYYEIQNGSQAECDARKKTTFCEFPNMGPDKATVGFATCGPVVPPVTQPPVTQPPVQANCTFNGQTVANGNPVTAYQSASVPFGSTCASQSRVCTNGNLSGTYTFSSCSVASASGCTFNGQAVANGNPVTAYQSASVPFGSTCASQSRICTNGNLSGSYTFANCIVEPQQPPPIVDPPRPTVPQVSQASVPSGVFSYTLGQSFTFQWAAAGGYISMGQRNKIYSATNALIANNSTIADWNAASGTATVSTAQLDSYFQGTNSIRIDYEIMQKNNSGVWSSVGTYLSLTVIKSAEPQTQNATVSCTAANPVNTGTYYWDASTNTSSEVINWSFASTSQVNTTVINNSTGATTEMAFANAGTRTTTLAAGNYTFKFNTKNATGQKVPCSPASADIEILDSVGGVKGNIDEVTELSDGSVAIRGWSCVEKYAQSIDVHLYTGNASGATGATFVASVRANLANESAVNSACGTSGTSHRFMINLTKSQAQIHAGKKVYVHGIHPNTAGNKNFTIDSSGQKSIPYSADAKICEMVRLYASGNMLTEVPKPVNTKLTYLYGVSSPHSEDHYRVVWCSPGMTPSEMSVKSQELSNTTGGLWGNWQAYESQGYGMNVVWGSVMCGGGWVYQGGTLANNGKTSNLQCAPQTYDVGGW